MPESHGVSHQLTRIRCRLACSRGMNQMSSAWHIIMQPIMQPLRVNRLVSAQVSTTRWYVMLVFGYCFCMCTDLHDVISTDLPEHGCVCQKWLQECWYNQNTLFATMGTGTTPVCKHRLFAAYRPSGFSPQLRSAALAALHSPVLDITACMTILFSVLQVGCSHLQALTAYHFVQRSAWSVVMYLKAA